MTAIIGKKIGMTRIFRPDGTAVGVTVVQAGPCTVTQIKNKEKDGYKSIQIGYGINKKLSKPISGHLKESQVVSKILKEFRLDDEIIKAANELETPTDNKIIDYQIGDKITIENFKIGEIVKVTGKSKGKGFAGTVKRHGFTTGPKTHGSCNYRKPGSIGDTGPQRVLKGKRMGGHMGAKMITTPSVEIIDIDNDKNLLILKGAIPGPNKGVVVIRDFADSRYS